MAADLDGTLLPLLLDGSQGLTPLTIETVRTLTGLGITTILVTGRMFSSAATLRAGSWGWTARWPRTPGALIRDVGTGRLLHHDPLPLDLTREVLEFVEPEHLSVNLYIEDQLCVEKRTEAVDRYEALSGMKAIIVGRLARLHRAAHHQDGHRRAGGSARRAAGQAAGAVRLAGIIAVKTWPFFLEITNPTATKARALEILGGRMGFGPADVLAFGDWLQRRGHAGLGRHRGGHGRTRRRRWPPWPTTRAARWKKTGWPATSCGSPGSRAAADAPRARRRVAARAEGARRSSARLRR